jgi:hypothetical protein
MTAAPVPVGGVIPACCKVLKGRFITGPARNRLLAGSEESGAPGEKQKTAYCCHLHGCLPLAAIAALASHDGLLEPAGAGTDGGDDHRGLRRGRVLVLVRHGKSRLRC